MWHWLVETYRHRIVDSGREPLFLLLIGLIVSFLFIRFSVRMIRRGVRWWPGNVRPGGLHIHHVVFGQAMMLIGGIGSFALRGKAPVAHDVLAVIFGIGCGLVLDEFALVLHLEDVYWSEQGRKSVDAVILAIAWIALLLLGNAPLGGFSGPLTAAQIVYAVINVGCVVISLLKGKVWTGLLGVMFPLIAVVGAIRLARPASPWARWRYHSRPRRLARAERRDQRVHRRVVAVRTSVYNALAGAPHLETVPAAAARAADQVRKRSRERAPGRAQLLPADLGPSRVKALLRPLSSLSAAAVVWYLRAAATLDVVTGLIAPFRERVHLANSGGYFTPFLVTAGFTAALLAFLLAVMLHRRKHAAWIITTLLAGGNAVLYWLAMIFFPEIRVYSLNWVSAGISTAILLALLIAAPACRVRGERGNIALGLAYFAVGGVVAAGLGTVLVHQTDTPAPASWGVCLQYAVLRIFTLSSLFGAPDLSVPAWTDLGINVLSLALFLQVLRAFFRSPRGRTRLQPTDETRLRALLEDYGQADSLGYFALRRDKAVSWSPSGNAAVLYRVANGVALASGDPIGDPEGRQAAIAAWLETARTHAWVPAVASASRSAAMEYERVGFKVLAYGDEAVISVASFTLQGEAMRGLYGAHRRMRSAGYTVVVRRHRDISEPEMSRLAHLANAWRHGTADRGLTMVLGRLGDPADGACVMVECRDAQDRTCALMSLVPWGGTGLTLDLMRRDRESAEELTPYMITELLLRAREGAGSVAGIDRVSLNLTTFHAADTEGTADGRPGTGPVFRLYRGILRVVSRRQHLEALHRANAAFRPGWEQRFMLYERRTELPRIAIADATAEGFVLAPRLRGASALSSLEDSEL
ncbi:MAG: DUF2156 domain-containing protein [Streptomycetaceae bacterium]|nr:DUF2156 domain-containing protein [Streptomycetaceae bacterium]